MSAARRDAALAPPREAHAHGGKALSPAGCSPDSVIAPASQARTGPRSNLPPVLFLIMTPSPSPIFTLSPTLGPTPTPGLRL